MFYYEIRGGILCKIFTPGHTSGDAVKTDQELSLLFPVGLQIFADMVSQVHRFSNPYHFETDPNKNGSGSGSDLLMGT